MADQQEEGLEFTAFELAVLNAILTDDKPRGPDSEEFVRAGLDATDDGQRRVFAILRAQLYGATIKSRDFSGAGFFTYFSLSDTVVRVATKRIVLGHVHVESPEIEHGAGSVLFVDDGVVHFLETFTYTDEMWSVPRNFTLSYPGWDRSPSGEWISESRPEAQ